MKNKLLLIIDPQNDFISGSLKVDGATEMIKGLVDYLTKNHLFYNAICLTQDNHPSDHCSFETWPPHCVQGTHGAEIESELKETVYATTCSIVTLRKGEDKSTEEYSAFVNEENKKQFLSLLESEEIEEIDICGIAGDFCVLQSIQDLIALGLSDKITVLTKYISSIDRGARLSKFIEDTKLEINE